jgi:dienelactone hydrolase
MRQKLSSGTSVTVASPNGGVRRGLVVLPDMGGLGPNFDRIAAELAHRCSAAVGVVELFPGREHLTFQERLEFGLGEISEATVLADAAETADLLGVAPTSILGFCIGGALAMRAASVARYDRIVSLYGMVHLPPSWTGDKGDPLVAVAATTTPVLEIAGVSDEFISARDLDELEEAGASVTRVPGARHGFAHNPEHPNFDPEAAASTWSQVVTFLGAVDEL